MQTTRNTDIPPMNRRCFILLLPGNVSTACAHAPIAGRCRPSSGTSHPLCFRRFPRLSGSVHSTEFCGGRLSCGVPGLSWAP